MDVYEKFDMLIDCLGEDVVLCELIRYFTTAQLEDVVKFIARNNDYYFDDDESED